MGVGCGEEVNPHCQFRPHRGHSTTPVRRQCSRTSQDNRDVSSIVVLTLLHFGRYCHNFRRARKQEQELKARCAIPHQATSVLSCSANFQRKFVERERPKTSKLVSSSPWRHGRQDISGEWWQPKAIEVANVSRPTLPLLSREIN